MSVKKEKVEPWRPSSSSCSKDTAARSYFKAYKGSPTSLSPLRCVLLPELELHSQKHQLGTMITIVHIFTAWTISHTR